MLWLSVSKGSLDAEGPVRAGELAVFEPGNAALDVQAGDAGDAVFVLGSAVPHPHDLALGNYSVHTSAQALQVGEARIAELGERLRASAAQRSSSGSVPIFR